MSGGWQHGPVTGDRDPRDPRDAVEPPRLAAWLLSRVWRGPAGGELLGDLAEEFDQIRRRRGVRQARRWYRRQAFRSLAGLVLTPARRVALALAALPGAAVRFARLSGDVGPAWRSLRRARWYSLTVIAVVTLSLSLATTVFAVVDGVLFKPLPFADADELVQVTPETPAQVGSTIMMAGNTSVPDLDAWRAAVPEMTFTATTFGGSQPIGEADAVRFAQVDARFFEVTGTAPLFGGFRDEDFGPQGPVRSALVSYAFWQARLGGDPGVIGRVLADRSGEGIRVAGVLPREFLFPHFGSLRLTVEALLPLYVEPGRRANPRARSLHVVARLPRSVPVGEAEQRLTAAEAGVAARFPPLSATERDGFRGPFVRVRLPTVRSTLTRNTRAVSMAGLAAAGFLVLLACLNLAGLAGSRMLDRRRELSMRRALGAGGVDLVRGMAVEHALLLGAGAVLGLVGARVLLAAVPWLLPDDFTLLKAPAVDARVAAVAVAACAVALTIVTAWSARVALRASLRGGLAGAGGTTARARSLGRFAIVGGQVALALAMVVGGTLFARSLARVWSQDPGFGVDRTAVFFVDTPRAVDLAYIDGVLDLVRRVPGVTAAGGLGGPFLQRAIMGSSFEPPEGARETGDVEHLRVTAGLLDALALHAIDGRLPTPEELSAGRPVLAVSRTVAEAYFPGRRAVGETLRQDGRPFEIVGVVPDVRYRSLDSAPEGEIYSPLAAWPDPDIMNMLVSYDHDAVAGMGATIRALQAGVPSLRLRRAMTVRQALGDSVQSRQFQAAVFVGFGLAALTVAAVGILGLVAMTAARRTREVGIRLTLGATPTRVVRLMVREQLPAVAAGLAGGTLVAVWGVRAVAAYLYEMSPYDWRAWGAAVVVLVLVSTAAAIVPSLGASRVDPVQALRVD
ncbi:MAG: ABC transporter permease [Vicinamibacterales bacterium]